MTGCLKPGYSIKLSLVLLIVLVASCATYYQKNYVFSQHFENGKIDEALRQLQSDKKAEKRKAKLLYYLNSGVSLSLLGRYEESNQFFEKAYLFTEDYQKDNFQQVASFVTNPNMIEYSGEDHEHLYINYYKALNYMQLGDYNSALVECKRMDIRLQKLNDKYSKKSFFQRDAFVHVLMGLIYDANKDYNNAFIAYRNAVQIYEEDYASSFGIKPPTILLQDLIRCAYEMSFTSDVLFYEKKYGVKYQSKPKSNGDLVMIWHNGLAPVKAEWSVNFSLVRGSGGYLTFANEEIGLNFPFQMNTSDPNQSSSLSDLEFIRVAFPKYVERVPVFSQCVLSYSGSEYAFEPAENINAIAFQGLKQRMVFEFGKSLLRVALKKGAEYQLRKQNQHVGMIAGVVNAVTEKADTRNWQTLPHSISYTRVSLPSGKHQINLAFKNAMGVQNQQLSVDVVSGQTKVMTYSTFDSKPGNGL